MTEKRQADEVAAVTCTYCGNTGGRTVGHVRAAIAAELADAVREAVAAQLEELALLRAVEMEAGVCGECKCPLRQHEPGPLARTGFGSCGAFRPSLSRNALAALDAWRAGRTT